MGSSYIGLIQRFESDPGLAGGRTVQLMITTSDEKKVTLGRCWWSSSSQYNTSPLPLHHQTNRPGLQR